INDLRSTLARNQMNDDQPLSASSFKSWSDSVTAKSESVERVSQSLVIKTVAEQTRADGQIIEARLTIRERDYHPTALYLEVWNGDGKQSFELTEETYEV